MSEKNPVRIKITDPDNPQAPSGGGRWVQDGEYMVQVILPTAMPTKPVNPKAEVVPGKPVPTKAPVPADEVDEENDVQTGEGEH